MIVLVDNDVVGAMRAIGRSLECDGFREVVEELRLRFAALADFGLPRDASDREVYRAAQSRGALLATSDRTQKDGAESLDRVISEEAAADCWPVLTLGNPGLVMRDRDYAIRCRDSLIWICIDIDNRRGERRIYLPER